MGELGRVPGGEERRGADAVVALELVSKPRWCPFSISSLAPPGTAGLARNQGVKTRLRGRIRGTKRKGMISQEKKNRAGP